VSSSKVPDQIPLFDDDALPEPDPSPKPWRSTPADRWSEEELPPVSVMEEACLDLLRRNLEFLRAMDLHAGKVSTQEIRHFRERHEELIGLLVRWLVDDDEECAQEARAAVRELRDLRLRALERLEPTRLRKVMAAEPRVRIRDLEIQSALRMAEFELAEARGEVVEIEIPALPDSLDSAGIVGPHMVEDLVAAEIHRMKAEQERRPLPPREGLTTLLRDLPVEWLDAVWESLDLGSDRPRRRKERERNIARHLTADGILTEVVGDGLSQGERRLLAFLLERGGKAPARAVAHRFGGDDDDGWFWNEEPPTSVLGRLRVRGLAFVGASPATHATRTVLVPRELRKGLKHALALAGTKAPEEECGNSTPGLHLRPELLEALNTAFPDGVVEPVVDGFDVEVVEDDVRRKLAGLEGASLLYRRTLEGAETWDLPEGFDFGAWEEGEEWERGEDREAGDEGEGYNPARSYAVFFLSLRGEGLQFEIEGDFLDDGGHRHPTKGVGRIGWAVAVSGVGPFALLRVTSLDSEEYFGPSSPDIESRYADTAGRRIAEEEVFRDMLGSEERGLLEDLRGKITRGLESLGIPCLSEEELQQPVPWLEAAEVVLVGPEEEAPLTVEDALFFQHFG